MISKSDPGWPLRIVHLEDSAADALLVRRLIMQEWPKARIDRVDNYQDFTDALRTSGVDLILADYSLPAFDGLAALDVARMTGPAVPFVFLSGTIAENVAAEALNNGAADYILKDRMGRLCPAIRRVLEDGEERRPLSQPIEARRGFRLVHVEDSEADAELIAHAIAREWPDVIIECVQTRESFVEALQQPNLDLILSDYSMPGFDGKSALALARSLRPEVPFIFLSGSIGEENAIEALKLGATDYILKDRSGRLRPAIRRALAETAGTQRGSTTADPAAPAGTLAERLQVLAAANTVVIWDWDLVTEANWWSPGMSALLGCASGENGPGPQELAAEAHPADAARLREGLRSALQGARRWYEEFRFRHRAGHFVRVRAEAAIVRDAEGAAVRMVGSLTALSDEPGTPPAGQSAQATQVEKLVNSMAHILSNILTPIIMGTGLLRLKPFDEEGEKLLSLMETSTKRGSKLVTSLMTSGIGSESDRETIPLGSLVSEAADALGNTMPSSVAVELHLAPDARNVIGDRGQLFGLVGILGANARDAMPNGGTLSIGVENVEVDEAMASGIAGARPGSYTVMTAADTGIGLPSFVRERLFEPFITTKKPGEGTGLGLFTAMYVARAHDGFISFASEEQKGTSFRVFLPADPAARPRN